MIISRCQKGVYKIIHGNNIQPKIPLHPYIVKRLTKDKLKVTLTTLYLVQFIHVR